MKVTLEDGVGSVEERGTGLGHEVAWRQSDDYFAWAPLPPQTVS